MSTNGHEEALAEMIRAALDRGWVLTPCNGKKPVRKGWNKETPLPLESLLDYAREGKNMGLRTGSISGIIVLDVDLAKGGEIPEGLPPTVAVETGSGGLHFYFSTNGFAIRNSVGKIARHVDVRGENGVAVLPGSVHPETGEVYRWKPGCSLKDVGIAPCPEVLLKNLQFKQPASKPPVCHTFSAYVQAAVSGEVKKVQSALEGTRNSTLNTAAFSLAGLLHTGELSENTIEQELVRAALDADLPESETRKTIASGIRGGKEHPRTIPNAGPLPTGSASKAKERHMAALENFRNVTIKEKDKRQALQITDISNVLFQATGNWPRRVRDVLFVDDDGAFRYLRTAPQLFAWLGEWFTLRWGRGQGLDGVQLTPKDEFFAHLQAVAKDYVSIEELPHEPRLPNRYYAWRPPAGYVPNGEHLNSLLSFFDNPETDKDTELIRAMFLTPAWGGLPGTRPAFAVMAPDRGYGKSTLTDAVAELYQGAVEVEPTDRGQNKVVTRLLSKESLTKRIVRLDNLKSLPASALLEHLMTTQKISGHRMYSGEGTRPNTLTFLITGNCMRLTRDLAERCVVIRLAKPSFRPGWREKVFGYIREHRDEILADIVAELKKSPTKGEATDRWQPWGEGVLSKCADNLNAILALTRERRGAMDEELEEAQAIQSAINAHVEEHRLHGGDTLFIPSSVMCRLVNYALNENWNDKKIATALQGHIESGRLPNVEKVRKRTARGYSVKLSPQKRDGCDACDTYFLFLPLTHENGENMLRDKRSFYASHPSHASHFQPSQSREL